MLKIYSSLQLEILKMWIDQMEFRTEMNELDLSEQEYLFRMRFRNDKVRQLQNQLFKMQVSYLENENKVNADDGAQEIYEHIVNLYFNQRLDSIYTQKLDLINDKNKLETAIFKNDQSLNFNDILKIKERAKEIQLQQYDIKLERAHILENLAIAEDKTKFDNQNIIGIQNITEVIEQLKLKTEGHPNLSLHQDRLALLEQEYRIEENDKENILRFAQIKYKDDDKLSLEREFSLGIGLTIPYRSINEANLTKIELERIEENYEQQERVLDMQNELREEKNELQNLIEKHSFLVEFIKEENLALLKSEYLRSQQVAPLPLINLELLIMDRQLELTLIEQEIYQQYIETLDSIGALRFSNNTNYLDRNLSPIE